MSIKNLFGKTVTSYEDVAQDVESADFINQVVAKRETYLPPIDFSDPANFAFYGSAELYYEAAIKRIYEDYPYDGSKAEQIEFEEKSSFLERWLFDNKYPKTTGYVQLGTTEDFGSIVNNIALTNTPEYIEIQGGIRPNSSAETLSDHVETSAKYDASNNRTQNWNCDFDEGVTVEFWMKKESHDVVNNPYEFILDLWDGAAPSSEKRLVISTTALSGTPSLVASIKDGTTPNSSALIDLTSLMTGWNHFAFTFYHEGGELKCDKYVNGEESGSTTTLQASTMSVTGLMNGFVGAAQTVFNSGGGVAAGKFEGYLDEFRFWKTRRTSRQIKLNWFREIGGGANTDDNTADLGVYLKFNEGVTGDSSIDSIILDYSGRLANGTWEGYPGSSVRSTGSAMNISGYTEAPSPIIYSSHPDVVALEEEMSLSGSDYDASRGQSFYRSLPNWLVEEDQSEGDENLRKLSQILASYLDTLRVQITSLNNLKDKRYTPDGYKAAPFAAELLKNNGFMVSDMFLSAEVFEAFSSVDYDGGQYDLNIEEIKNLIYTNIYNNLENIYSSKGTEKSIRNLIRCFGIDDELIKLNQYTDFGTQYLGDKYRTTSVKKKYLNLNNATHFSGTLYQSGSRTFISGSSNASVAAFTMEADILVPYKKKTSENGYFATPFLSASVMGFHEANPSDAADFTWHAASVGATTASLGLSSFGTNEIIFRGAGHPTQFENMEIELISTDQTALTYEFTSSLPGGVSNGDVYNGNVIVDLGVGVASMTTNFISAVDTAGHSGKIDPDTGGGSNRVTLDQVEPGVDGNTNISSSVTDTTYIFIPTSFTGGTSTPIEARDLQVYLARDSVESEHAKFVLKNQTETIYETSSYVYDIYNNEHYNVALRIKPQTYPYAGNVTNTTPDYDIELYAVSHNFDEIKEEVIISTTVDNTTGSAYLTSAKRIYAAAHYQDFTGSVLHQTDLQFGRVSAWLDYLPNLSIQEHNKDILNYGQNNSTVGSNAFLVDNKQVPSLDLSILNWDFDTVTTSNTSGEFTIEDTTSGSTDTIYGWIDNIIRREHDGKGENFPTESTAFLENEFLYANKKQLPETSFNANNIFIKGDEEINFSKDDDVSDNLFILEKSPAGIVSEEMMKLFSTTQEFSNLFGRNIDRYRIEYKDLSKARQLFYQRVEDGLDFDKFFTYFKWIDQSISEMINQLIPASVNFAGGVVDVIESHILERDKYQRQVGLLQTVTSTEASMRGVQELGYNWRIGHAPIPLDGTTNSLWQKERRERDLEAQQEINKVLTRQTDQEFTNPISLSGSSGTYSGAAYATRRFSRPYSVEIDFRNSIHGGTNYVKNKDRDLVRSGIGLHSPLGPSGAPKNVVTFGAGAGFGLNVAETLKTADTRGPSEKLRYDGFGLFGKFTSFQTVDYFPLTPDLDYYSRRKVCTLFPANFMSSSVVTGYVSTISASFRPGVDIVNLHSDTTDITNEIPIQGPFTERHVGGHQMRHVALNSVGKPFNHSQVYSTGLDSKHSRPEGYRLLLGRNPLVSSGSSTIPFEEPDADGAIGFVAPDYGIGSNGMWPDEDRLYAIFYREERAKRPINIKNIQTTTSSVYHGNYQHEYEVFSTFGDQGYFLRRNQDLLPQSIAEVLPETTNYYTLIAKEPTDAGNYFGPNNNRQVETATAVTEVKSSCSFRFHENSTGTNPDTVSAFDITIQRAISSAVVLKVADYGAGVNSGDVVFGGIVVNTHGTTWVNVADQFVLALNNVGAFGSTVTVSSTYNSSGADGKEVVITVAEATLIGTAGNGGALSGTSAHLEILTTPFANGVDPIAGISGNIIQTQDRSTGSANVIRTRFSAPGGPEINSSGYLDIATQQYSAHNSINFRNLTTRGSGSGEDGTIRLESHANRREGLRTLLSRHQGQFGIDSQYGATAELDYIAEASFHKQHRNSRKVAKIGDFNNDGTETTESINRYDNAHYNSTLPASDFQYSWVNSAISGSNWENDQIILTYAPRNGLISSSAGITEALVFPSASSLYGE